MPGGAGNGQPPVRLGRWRFAVIILIFVLLAPAVAAVSAVVVLTAITFLMELRSPTGLPLSGVLLGGPPIILLFALPVAYLLGALPAAVAGVFVASDAWRRGRPRWRAIWLGGLLAWGLVAGMIGLATGDIGAAMSWATILLAAALPATAACGWLVMRIMRFPSAQ